jgi:hypothetical protein
VRGPTRWFSIGLVAALLLAAAPSPAPAETRSGPCAIQRQDGQTVGGWVKDLIRCAAKRWDIPGGAAKAICIARAESGLNPKSTSSGGQYLGLFQHSADAWPDRYDAWTRKAWQLDPRARNGRTNTIVTIRMVNANGWGPWRGAGGC